jgi:hypothetical protein
MVGYKKTNCDKKFLEETTILELNYYKEVKWTYVQEMVADICKKTIEICLSPLK